MGWFHAVYRALYFSIGLRRMYRPQRPPEKDEKVCILVEPANARACRRNILAIASVVALAGLVGADPRDLHVFGITPDNDFGVVVLAVAVILVYVYWYVQLYLHLTTDGKVDRFVDDEGTWAFGQLHDLLDRSLQRRSADLVANWITFILVLVSVCFLMSWADKV